ncbi:NAD(P)-dependent alcohol dehydrogenase [Apibacter adventoris]|uniref:Enoyl reductase (ER) domain-containing protein n=1 Tax=Apibacter adventoris TaxID=1679466 RepID=A0A2S8AAX9_9FLAO|nr:NAD(P)-dependent alcohol dehydrogenase [Apibacter adventoris]PQL91714.1 hypothetical protein C4S77_07900 [Apibacter adventoris]
MKKVIYNKCGDPNVLKIVNIDNIDLKGQKDKILVKVLFSSINAVDWKYRRGDFRFFTKMFNTDLGYDIVGEVINVPSNVVQYKKGDIILGLLPTLKGGAHSECVLLSVNQCITVNSAMDLKELAGIPMAGVTAWISLIEKAKLRKGQSVLINGGSSGVGHLAIQLAKAYGAEVTSVSSGKNELFCRQLGADHTINYETENFRESSKKYDIIFDVVSNTSVNEIKPILNPRGYFIDTNISFSLIKDMLLYPSKVKFVYVYPYKKALTDLYRLVEEKKIHVHIDKIFTLNQIVDAHKYAESSRTTGKVIIKINGAKI